MGEKNVISPFGDASGKKVSMLVSTLVERFGVPRMHELKKKFFIIIVLKEKLSVLAILKKIGLSFLPLKCVLALEGGYFKDRLWNNYRFWSTCYGKIMW